MGMLLILVPSAFASCDLPQAFSEYFDEALVDLEATAITKIMEGFEDIGLGPLGNSLPVTSFFNIKEDLFDVVFGDQAQFQFGSEDFLDLTATLGSSVSSLPGGMAELILNCNYDTAAELFSLDIEISSPQFDLDISNLPPADVTFLPDSLPSLDVSGNANLTLSYGIKIPLALSLPLKTFFVNEVTTELTVGFEAELDKSLPILPNDNATFQGRLDLGASLSYSSISDWDLLGYFDASLAVQASTSVSTGVTSLGLSASDPQIFDTVPRKYLTLLPTS